MPECTTSVPTWPLNALEGPAPWSECEPRNTCLQRVFGQTGLSRPTANSARGPLGSRQNGQVVYWARQASQRSWMYSLLVLPSARFASSQAESVMTHFGAFSGLMLMSGSISGGRYFT